MAGLWMGGPHATSNLAGYPARDYGAPGNTPVYAWSTLRVERISGQSGYRGGGFGGLNVYLRDRAGKTYFMTHVENLRVKAGQVVQPGQQIAQVGNYGTPHVHLGYTGGDPSTVLGIRPEYLFTPGGAVAGSKAVENESGRRKSGGGIGGFLKDATSVSGVDIVEGITGKDLPDIDANPLDVVTAPYDAIKWVGSNWDRVLEVVGGFILLLVGLILLGRSLGVGGARVKSVGGDIANRVQFGPEVTQATRDPGLSKPRVVYTDEPRFRSKRTSSAGPSDEIPY